MANDPDDTDGTDDNNRRTLEDAARPLDGCVMELIRTHQQPTLILSAAGLAYGTAIQYALYCAYRAKGLEGLRAMVKDIHEHADILKTYIDQEAAQMPTRVKDATVKLQQMMMTPSPSSRPH